MKRSKADLYALWKRVSPWVLGGLWILGMSLGVSSAQAAEEVLVPLIRQSVRCRGSALGLFSAAMLPFLLSALAVSLSEPWLLLIISTLKAFSFTFCAYGVSLAFGSSSWLVRFFFLFSDLCLIPVMYIYWLRHLQGSIKTHPLELPGCLIWTTVVSLTDYCFISPYLASIMER